MKVSLWSGSQQLLWTFKSVRNPGGVAPGLWDSSHSYPVCGAPREDPFLSSLCSTNSSLITTSTHVVTSPHQQPQPLQRHQASSHLSFELEGTISTSQQYFWFERPEETEPQPHQCQLIESHCIFYGRFLCEHLWLSICKTWPLVVLTIVSQCNVIWHTT